ncbi:Aspartyl/asparaginyl beta-hydroxylase, partial [Merops nubicus]
DTKHGGSRKKNRNGKKEGLSGSSFFTWFMVIALLGVWTSVAVVWFELVDYEEVLAKAKDFRYNLSEVLQGKLGIYDADGDGDFDVEDAKVLLGKYKHRPLYYLGDYLFSIFLYCLSSVLSYPQVCSFSLDIYVILHVLTEMLAKIWGLLSVPAQPASPESEESIQPAEKPYVESELEEEIQSVLQESLHSQPASYEYDVDVEKTVSDPEAPGESELTLEDAVEHYTGESVLLLREETQGTRVAQQCVVSWFTVLHLFQLNYIFNILGKSKEETEPGQTEKVMNCVVFKSLLAKKKKKPKLLNKFDKTIKAELDAAEKLRKKGKVEEALRAFEALVNRYPQSPRARYGKAQSEDDLAEKMRSNEMLQKAINTYDEVVSLPNVPSDLIKLSLKREADRQQFLGRMRGSLVTLQKLVQLFPSDTSFKNDLGVGYLLIGDNSNAKKVYEEVLSLAPDDGFAKVHYGFILKAENKIAESIPYLKEGLESGHPGTDDGRFYFHLGDALQRMGDKEAYKWYELGYQRGHFASVWQRSLYNVKGLKAQPWWTARETGYTELVK